jgi:DNA-binding transcriptional LysR family regulator
VEALHEEADVTETLEAVIAFERVNVPAVETAKVWGLVQKCSAAGSAGHRSIPGAVWTELPTIPPVDNLAMAMSLIASTRGVALLPIVAKNFLPLSVTSRPLDGEAPAIDLVIGYNKTNTSPILRLFLSRLDQLRKKAPQTH